MMRNAKEYCCYTRLYSDIEGLQLAHTLTYSASALAYGVVLELQLEQGGQCYTSRVVCPAGSFGRAMPLMRYLCENGIGPGAAVAAGKEQGAAKLPAKPLKPAKIRKNIGKSP